MYSYLMEVLWMGDLSKAGFTICFANVKLS